MDLLRRRAKKNTPVDSATKQNDDTQSDSKNVEKLVQMKKGPVKNMEEIQNPEGAVVARTKPSRSKPFLDAPTLVLLTKLVPSIPIELFKVLAEIIEVATERPTSILYESRKDRPPNDDIVDIAILPMTEKWENGVLLPVSFSFEDRFNINKKDEAHFFADLAITNDVASRITQDILDLRGCRCALANRDKSVGSASLLFNFLQSRGEGPAFFGNILNVDHQIDALRMVAGKQVDVAILESPVIMCNKNLPGIETLHTLASLGPLPPYRIMTNKKMPGQLAEKITNYLKNLHEDQDWMEKLKPFKLLKFSENCESNYTTEVNSIVTTAPYY